MRRVHMSNFTAEHGTSEVAYRTAIGNSRHLTHTEDVGAIPRAAVTFDTTISSHPYFNRAHCVDVCNRWIRAVLRVQCGAKSKDIASSYMWCDYMNQGSSASVHSETRGLAPSLHSNPVDHSNFCPLLTLSAPLSSLGLLQPVVGQDRLRVPTSRN